MSRKEYSKKRRDSNRIRAVRLLGSVCAVCGDSGLLEFDHVDRTSKNFTREESKMKQMEDLGADELDGLYKLYRAVCERDDSEPDLKSFHIYLVEEGYVSD